MASEHLIDLEIRALLDFLPQMELNLENLPAFRAGMLASFGAIPVKEDLPVTVEMLTAPGPAGAPPVKIFAYRPENIEADLPAILHIHGGGYVLGTPEMMDAANRVLAVDLGCAIFSVDYRLAPETPAPGAVEDCYAAFNWITQNAPKLRINPARIGVKGESAGGGLAAALALLVRDRGELSLAFQHLIYPMLDDRTCVRANPHPFAGEFVWTVEHNVFGWSSLLGTAPGAAGISPYAAAARAERLDGLPPSFISVGALDLFLDEDIDYATRLLRAGVPVEFHIYPGAFHGFDLAPGATLARTARRDSKEALRRALRG